MKQMICLWLCFTTASLSWAQTQERTTLIINESKPSQHLDWVYDASLQLGHFESCAGEICLIRGEPFRSQGLPGIYAYFEKEAYRMANDRQLKSPLTKRQRLIGHYSTVAVVSSAAIPIYAALHGYFSQSSLRTTLALGIVMAAMVTIFEVNGHLSTKYKKAGEALTAVISQLQTDQATNHTPTLDNTSYRLLTENLHLAIQSLAETR